MIHAPAMISPNFDGKVDQAFRKLVFTNSKEIHSNDGFYNAGNMLYASPLYRIDTFSANCGAGKGAGEQLLSPALLPGGARRTVLPFAFQYDSNKAKACRLLIQSSLIQCKINSIVHKQ